MNKILLHSFILIIIFSSCNLFRENNYEKIPTAEKIENIIAGKDTTDSFLLIFHDKKLPSPGKANHIKIDTFISNGKKYYYVLAEYPNPLYNRFAIIDNYSNVLLIDKSLNGHLTESILNTNNSQFIKIEENFISKDSLGLKRVSLYTLDYSGKAVLAFRTYTELKAPNVRYSQEIIKLNPEEIITKIGIDRSESEMTDSSDKFIFDTKMYKYISKDSNFDSFVRDFVANFKSNNLNPVIDVKNTLIHQPEKIESKENNPHHFSLPLSYQWDEIKNVKVSYLMKKLVIGTKYINNQYGAEITVIQLPDNDSSESYIKYSLVNVSTGNYKVRYSEKVADGIYFYQFFEYSCSGEKFLLILQTLKSTYETYRSEYQNLINSFSMGC